MENLIISNAGIGPRLSYFGCGNLVKGKSKEPSISFSVIVGKGGLMTNVLPETSCIILRAFNLFDSCSITLKFEAKVFLSFKQASCELMVTSSQSFITGIFSTFSSIKTAVCLMFFKLEKGTPFCNNSTISRNGCSPIPYTNMSAFDVSNMDGNNLSDQ